MRNHLTQWLKMNGVSYRDCPGQLPQPFHKDPADQIIVATARIYDCPLMTCDTKILAYPHLKLLP
jgi:PIN domain nuclease of toxin-antitoxin system